MKDNKIAIVFVSGSVGELDWNLETLKLLLNEGFELKFIVLKIKALDSIKKNKMVNDFINQKNDKIEIIFKGGQFIERVRYYTYLLYRIILKLSQKNSKIQNNILGLFYKIFQKTFSYNLPHDILINNNKKYLFLFEFPSMRHPWNSWLKNFFDKSIFIYHPHSQAIYAQKFEEKYSSEQNINFYNNHFLLLGHQLDYLYLNDGKELASAELEKVFIGHPNWSQNRLAKQSVLNKKFNKDLLSKETNILILSKHFGKHIDEKDHSDLAVTCINAIKKLIPNSNIFIKKHPREKLSQWDQLAKENLSIKIIDNHVQQIASKMSFVISFWNSASVDCHCLGVPVIEYYNTIRFRKGMIFENGYYTSIYRKLGLVLPANNQEELEKAISNLIRTKFKLPIDNAHPFFKELLNLSNMWEKKFKNILKAHDFV